MAILQLSTDAANFLEWKYVKKTFSFKAARCAKYLLFEFVWRNFCILFLLRSKGYFANKLLQRWLYSCIYCKEILKIERMYVRKKLQHFDFGVCMISLYFTNIPLT